MISAILSGKEISVLDLDIRYAESKIPEFTVTISAEHIDNPTTVVFMDIAVYKDGAVQASGLVSEHPLLELDENGVITYKLKCDTDLGRLYLEMAADVQFQNVSVSTAINTLFAEAQDSVWSINSSVTLATEDITLDVRDKESLWAQIKYIMDNASEPVFLRYMGFSGGSHQVDIGSFGSDVRTHDIIKGFNVVGTPKLRQLGETPISELRPISGKVGVKPVRLSEALSLEPTLATDPDYPLQSSTQSILNNTVSVGRRLRKRFTGHKTSNATPVTATQRAQVALSLYYRGVREIKAAAPYNEIRVDVFLPSPPPMYDNVYVDIVADMMVYNPLTETEQKVTAVTLQGFYRVKSWQLKYKTNYVAESLGENVQGNLYSIELTNGYEIESPEDKAEVINKKLETNDLEDNAGVIVGVLDTVDVPVTHTSVAADCNYIGVNTGKSFTFPLPTIPSGATAITTEIVSVDPSTTNTATVIQAATLLLPLIICASAAGGAAWTALDNTTITVRYTFT
jgi:hypothetical protein